MRRPRAENAIARTTGYAISNFFVRIAALLLLLTGGSQTAAADEAALWQALNTPGHIAVMRHALAPGGGDPDNFELRDCSTQRNLSDGGRAQAKRIGARLRANGVLAAHVYSSQWCRCLETARLLGFGKVKELSALNSFFATMDKRTAQTAALQDWIEDQPLDSPTVLVTHQVNITALTNYDFTGYPNLFHFFALLSLSALIPAFYVLQRAVRLKDQKLLEEHARLMMWSYYGLAAAGVAQVATRVLPPIVGDIGRAFMYMGLSLGVAGMIAFLVFRPLSKRLAARYPLT